MGGSASQPEGGPPPKGYDVLQVIPQDDPTWAEIEELINERQQKYMHHYKNQFLRMTRLWRIRPGPGIRDAEEQRQGFGPPMRLFHGTDVAAAQQIVEAGFQIPKSPGMFGRGVYFARSPLKSEMYSKGAGLRGAGFAVSSMFRRVVQGKEEPNFASRVMLLCDVYLGNSKCERCLPNIYCGCYADVSSPEDIKPTCLDYVFCPHQCCYYGCKGGFDSVHAPGGQRCNAVKVTEYVVFDPDQATPLFLIEFDAEKIGHDAVGRAVSVKGKTSRTTSMGSKATQKNIELRS